MKEIKVMHSKNNRLNMPFVLFAAFVGYCTVHGMAYGKDDLKNLLNNLFDMAVFFL